MHKKLHCAKIIAAVSLMFSANAVAEISVIVHPSNAAQLDKNQLKRIYLGKQKSFANGNIAIPIDLDMANVRDNFNEQVLSKSSSQIKAYWSKLIFTGKGTPPKALKSAQDVISAVESNPGTIGYIDSADVAGNVKVAFKF